MSGNCRHGNYPQTIGCSACDHELVNAISTVSAGHRELLKRSASAPRRPSKSEYMMWLAVVSAKRGTCDRRRVGCALAVDDHVVSMGYNGSAPDAPHCDDDGHLMHDGHCVRTIHAEANAIAHAARMGVSLKSAQAYCTCRPCPTCLLLLASAGVEYVWYLEPYHAEEDSVSDVLLDGIRTMQVLQYIEDKPWETP